jgi:hypothetical protein
MTQSGDEILIAAGEDAPFFAIAGGDDTVMARRGRLVHRGTVSASICAGALRALTKGTAAY